MYTSVHYKADVARIYRLTTCSKSLFKQYVYYANDSALPSVRKASWHSSNNFCSNEPMGFIASLSV